MPYKNIVFVKLEKRLLNDARWYMMTEESQLNYLRLLLLSADTYNKVPEDLRAIKLAFKTKQSTKTIKKTLEEIQKNFPKFKHDNGYYYFEGFEEKTNWVNHREKLGNSRGVPRELTDKDKDKEEKDKEKEEEYTTRFEKFATSLVSRWNDFCSSNPQLRKVTSINPTRRKKLKARFAEGFIPKNLDAIFLEIDKSRFLKHGNPNSKEHGGWKISFDWIITNDSNAVKICEGQYSGVVAKDELAEFEERG